MKPATTVSMLGCLAVLLLAAQTAWADTPAETDARFFMLLSYKDVATMGDGYQAMAMLVRHEGTLTDPAKCRDLLRERKVARASWGDDLAAPLPKGRLAYMVCQALGIKGGLTMRLFGPSERYCLFECKYLELMAGGAQYQHCAGGELVSVIDRADQYQVRQAEATEGDATEVKLSGAEPAAGQAGTPEAAKAANQQKTEGAETKTPETTGDADNQEETANAAAGQETSTAGTPRSVKPEIE